MTKRKFGKNFTAKTNLNEPVGNLFSGSQHFYDSAGATDKTLKFYEGHYHDMLNDLDKEVVMADIQNWIDERIPASNETSAVSGA